MVLVACYTFEEAFSGRETQLEGYREAHFTSVLGRTFCQLELSSYRMGRLKNSLAPGHHKYPCTVWTAVRKAGGEIPILGRNSLDNYSNSFLALYTVNTV